MFDQARPFSVSCGAVAVMCSSVLSPCAVAQDRSASAMGLEEIVVTARKRDETLQSVPVVIAAISQEELSRRSIVDLDGIARTVPQLIIGPASGSLQGGAIALRGVSAGDANVFGDQAVAFNVDGVQVARSSVRRMSEFDMSQVEVLKGPQALYFGKNSPGGIVVIHSADPTSELSAKASAGYEFEGSESRLEGYVSGPLTDRLGARLAVFGSALNGWVDNIATPSAIYGPAKDSVPRDREFGGRLTLKLEANESFDARFKFAYGSSKNQGLAGNTQRVDCPLGTPQLGGPDDCTADDRVVRADLGPNFAVLNPLFRNSPFADQQQYLSGLELNYRVSPALTLSSLTGYYKSSMQFSENFNAADSTFPTRMLAAGGSLDIRETSEEIRLTSNFEGPVNFMLGGYYQDSTLDHAFAVGLNAAAPVFAGVPFHVTQDGKAYSGFGSISYKPIEVLEFSGGARYSYEEKTYRPFNLLTGAPFNPALPGGTLKPKDDWSNVSPEASITWRPSDQLTVFTAYKKGFLSGGFNAGNGDHGLDRSYDEQTIEGYEVGLKGMFLDELLRLNAAVYRYKLDGQQVTSLVGITQVVKNAASSRAEGAELDLTWVTPLDGLTVRGGAAYSRARYLDYAVAPCYAGQTVALGCNQNLVSGIFRAQDLSGKPLVRAPEWGGNVGSSYEMSVGNGHTLGFSIDGNYTSSFFTDATDKPASTQDAYWLLDATIRAETASGIELALIGRNLTNEYFFQRSADNPLTGSGTGTATGVGTDTVAYVSRGREIQLRVTVPLAY